MNINDMEHTPYHKSDNRKIVLVKDFEEDKEYQKARKREFIRIITIIGIVIVVLVALGLGIRFWLQGHTYSGMKVVEQTELSVFTSSGYTEYAEGTIRYGSNGAEYIDDKGTLVWNAAYEMKRPNVFVEGTYAVIADIGGNRFVVCDLKGLVSDVSTDKTIIDADISASGAVCVVLDDETADYVNFYDNKGSILDIEIKTLLAGDGYPLDMALSPSGQILMMSYLYMNEGTMLNKVVFYNFSELGQNYSDRLVGVFNYNATMVPAVDLLSDEYACAFAEDKVDFYSLKDSTKPALANSCEYTVPIESIFTSKEYVGVISQGSGGTAEDNLDIYTPSGVRTLRAAISCDFSEVKFSDNRVVFNNNNQCVIYNINGRLKYEGALDGEIDFVKSIKDNRLIKFADNMMSEIKLKY